MPLSAVASLHVAAFPLINLSLTLDQKGSLRYLSLRCFSLLFCNYRLRNLPRCWLGAHAPSQHRRTQLSAITQRLVGLADLNIDTAGGADIELKLFEMNKSNAEDFCQFLSWHIGQQKVADADEVPELRAKRQAAVDEIEKNRS